MPEYNFRCSKKKCSHEFTEFCSFQDYDEGFVSIECPVCGKNKPKKVFQFYNVGFNNNPDKMNNFSYAAEKNFERAQGESIAARQEAKKKGIVSPYANLPDFTDNGRRMNFVD